MKLSHLLNLAVLTSLLAAMPLSLRADPQNETDKRKHVREMISEPETSRMAFEEMMKDSEKKRYMAKVMARDKEFREMYAAEVGTDAPHEERNPSDHPELFKPKTQ